MSRDERFDGWRVVAGLFVVLATTSGLGFYNLGLYLTALKDEHGFSEGPLSGATAVVFALSGLAGLPIGSYMRDHDPRRLLYVSSVTGAVALLLIGSVSEIWQVYAAYALLAVGFATGGLVPCYSIVTRWFERRRAVAMSVTSTGLSVGGIVFTPLFEWVLDRQGLGGAAPWMAIAWLVGVAPVAWLLVRPDPESLGQHPDGEAPAPLEAGAVAPSRGWSFEDAVRTRYFAVVAVAYVLVLGSQVGGIVHVFNLVDGRIDSSTAARAVALVAVSSIVSRLVGGVGATRVPLQWFTVVFCFVQGFGLLLLGQLDGRTGLLAAAVLFGSSVGNLLMLQPLLLSGAFGVVDYPRIYARANAITAIGLVVGPLGVGVLKDALDAYDVPFTIIAGCATAAGVLLAVAGREPEVAGTTTAAPAASTR